MNIYKYTKIPKNPLIKKGFLCLHFSQLWRLLVPEKEETPKNFPSFLTKNPSSLTISPKILLSKTNGSRHGKPHFPFSSGTQRFCPKRQDYAQCHHHPSLRRHAHHLPTSLRPLVRSPSSPPWNSPPSQPPRLLFRTRKPLCPTRCRRLPTPRPGHLCS